MTNSDNEGSPNQHPAQSIRRIMRESIELQQSRNPYWTAAPINEEDPYEWHFTVRGPVATEFEGGLYHGRIVLPQNYPLAPPSFTILNQNGRFEVGRKVCLSASNYHPELWQPAWGIRTMLDALHAFFATPGDGALHSLNWSADVRRQLALESAKWCCPVCRESNSALIEKNCEDPSPIRPALPPAMIPEAVARSCPYLRSSGQDPETFPPSDNAEEASALQTSEPPETTEETPLIQDESQDLEQRRRRRARDQGTPDRQTSLTLSLLFHIFCWRPIQHLLSPLFDPLQSRATKIVRVIDILCVVLAVVTTFLLADLYRHPRALSTVLFLDDGDA